MMWDLSHRPPLKSNECHLSHLTSLTPLKNHVKSIGKNVFPHNKSLHDEEHQQSWFGRLVEFIQTIFLDAKNIHVAELRFGA